MDAGELETEAQRLRGAGALGRPGVLTRLFDFLVAAAHAPVPPKEAEIAHAVFGKAAAFDGGQDATVRVYVHRLRKKLEDHYAGPGRAQAVRLTIPKGEYRLVARPADDAEIAASPPPARPRRPWAIPLALLAVINLAAWAGWWATHRDALSPVRHAVPWAGLGSGERPLLLVLGDYYIFADIDEATGSGRLVREYGVNSREDLDAWLMDHPEAMGRYRDLDLFYLPVGAAFALRDVLPVLVPKASQRDDVRVVMASDLTPEMLKRNDVLYVGFLSGLRMLRDPVFAGSRFKVGETYDDLIDTRTGKLYASQEGGPDEQHAAQRDYGYFAAFRGPTGNRIVILAGDRDMGLMQAAEQVTSPASLKAIRAQAKGADAFEALFEAQGLRRANLGGRLILAAPLAADRIWSPPKTPPTFPAG